MGVKFAMFMLSFSFLLASMFVFFTLKRFGNSEFADGYLRCRIFSSLDKLE
jgi:hypothetical protein